MGCGMLWVGKKSKKQGGAVPSSNINSKLLLREGIKQIRSIELFHHQQQACWFLIDLANGPSKDMDDMDDIDDMDGHGWTWGFISKW